MEQPQPLRRSSQLLLDRKSHDQEPMPEEEKGCNNGPRLVGSRSGFRSFRPRTRNWGHLRPTAIRSSLLPSEKDIIAMSRSQFLAHLRSSSTDGAHIPEIRVLDNKGRRRGIRGNGVYTRIAADTDGGPAVDKLSVGVCIFRLDRETLRPAALLLRRSQRWWRCRVFTSATAESEAPGEWELPGGRVEDDDFCLSAAIERLVREELGLRVTKIMVMLSSVKWKAELKVLLWDTTYNSDSSENEDSDDDDDEDRTRVESRIESALDLGWRDDTPTLLLYSTPSSVYTSTTTPTTGKGERGRGARESAGLRVGQRRSGRDRTSSPSYATEIDLLRYRFIKNSLSSSSSSSFVALTPTTGSASRSGSGSCSNPPPPPPPLPPRNSARLRAHAHVHDWDDKGDERSSDDNAYKSVYEQEQEQESEHDPSLEPAPLFLPSRTTKAALTRKAVASPTTRPPPIETPVSSPTPGATAAAPTLALAVRERTLRRRNTASSTTLPIISLSLYSDDVSSHLISSSSNNASASDNGNSTSDNSTSNSHSTSNNSKSQSNDERRRDAQMIPYKIVQQENLQLNFGVLVDEDGYGCQVPAFLAGGFGPCSGGGGGDGAGRMMKRNKTMEEMDKERSKDNDESTGKEKGNGQGKKGKKGNDKGKGVAKEKEKESDNGKEKGGCYEHDALEWATCARIEKMPMSEDLRQVVLEGLAWMGKLTERCF
ncbi:hypothetical protein F5Y03DRAFT_136529 [Xylaria venustula]|nr:hypothetical protein F5Y03DRAFT_136529 [Xylaria venustula]